MKKIHWLFIATFLAIANTSRAACSHSLCVQGEALVYDCDFMSSEAVRPVCDRDAYCCSVSWDLTCTLEAESIGGINCSFTPTPTPTPTWPGPCAHNWQLTGTALESGCTQCVTDICTRDAYCCDPTRSWDATCVAEVASFGLASCFTPTPTPTNTPTNTPTHTNTPTNTPTPTVTQTPTPAGTPYVVISQAYGGGGASGAIWKNDFVEIFNAGSTSQDLSGWSVQYATSASTTWTVVNLSGTISPGEWRLIGGSSGGSDGSTLPTVDFSGIGNLNASQGKVALLSTTTALSGSCPGPPPAGVVDFLGYGAVVACYETSRTSNPGNATSALRDDGGCTDTNNNGADFTVTDASTPGPRNSSTTADPCP